MNILIKTRYKFDPQIRQRFLDFYHQDIYIYNDINKLNDAQKRLFVLMCIQKEKHFFSNDTFSVVSLADMNTLFKCFLAIQILDITDMAKYEMMMNIRYLYMETPCKKIDLAFLVTAVFKDDLIYQLVHDLNKRNKFIEAPYDFLSSYKNDEKSNENEVLTLTRRKELADSVSPNNSNLNDTNLKQHENNFKQMYSNAIRNIKSHETFKCSRLTFSDRQYLMKFAQDAIESNNPINPKDILYFTDRETDYFIRCFLLGGGDIKKLPNSWQKSSIAKDTLLTLQNQNDCVPKNETSVSL